MNFMYNGKNILAIVRDLTDSGLAEVAMKIAETHPDVFAEAVLGEAAIYEFTMEDGTPVRMTRSQIAQIDSSRDKIVAIKQLREWFGLGLREAKLLSETLARQKYVQHAHWVPETNNW
jgi:ribosomal protein L7/L12